MGNDMATKQNAYITALLSAIAADGVVDDGEVLQMYELFAVFETDSTERCALIEALWMDPIAFQSVEIATELKDDPELSAALARDLLLVDSKPANSRKREVADKLRRQFSLGAEQIRVLEKYVTFENQLLRSLGAGKEWITDEGKLKDLVGRAAALGIPLAALNVAGIGGFGAVGITSGLAALGSMSGLAVLGLNPMTAGIGALILAGITVKKVADYVLADDADDADDAQKAAALEEVKMLRRRAATYMADDMVKLGRPRNTELLRPRRRERRTKLIATLKQAHEEAISF